MVSWIKRSRYPVLVKYDSGQIELSSGKAQELQQEYENVSAIIYEAFE
jgi:hypothetical protein